MPTMMNKIMILWTISFIGRLEIVKKQTALNKIQHGLLIDEEAV